MSAAPSIGQRKGRFKLDRLRLVSDGDAVSAPTASALIAASIQGRRGLVPSYYPGSVNHCPSCGGTAWHVGRETAECGHCQSPLPIAAIRHTRLTIKGE